MPVDVLTPLTATAAITTNTAPATGTINRYNASGGALSVTLPALSGLTHNSQLIVEKDTQDASGNTVTVSRSGSDVFDDGRTAVTLSTPGAQLRLQVVTISAVKKWKVVGGYTPTRKSWRNRDALWARELDRLVYPTANAPTVTFATNLSNNQMTGAAIGGYIDVVANGQVSLFGACNPQHVGSFPGTVTYKNICRQQDINGSNTMDSFSYHFYSDSDKVEVVWICRATPQTYRVWVDDQVIGSTTPVSVTGTPGFYESILITNASAKMRRYRIDLTSRADVGGIFLNSTASPSKYSIWAAEQRGPTAFFFGDSMLGGSNNSTSYAGQIPHYIGDLFGWDNVFCFGVGGIGYNVKNAPSSFDNSALPQITYTAPSTATPSTTIPGSNMSIPDIVVIAYGHNDTVAFSGATQTAATNTYSTARSQWPNALIVAMGPVTGGAGGTTYNSSETTMFTNIATYVDGTISSLQGTNRPWLTGTGNTSATTGTGNGDLYIGSDATHPNDAGIAYFAERLAPELRKLMT